MSENIVSKETREFQAETKKLLDLMIHSIYTNREIFLRELISNASDAIDKLKFESLTNHNLLNDNNDFEVFLLPDEATKTLTISDNGMGMTYDEVVENIGTIAKSGTKIFLEKLKENETVSDQELIGQFGVGFYSAFMVADKVTIITRSAKGSTGVKWESTGDGTYTIEEFPKDKQGTTIILSLKDEFCSNEHFEENFTNNYTLMNLVKKYSDYIRYPIKMNFVHEDMPRDEEGKEIEGAEKVKTVEVRTLNSMKPLWAKNKNDITTEEYNDAYKNLFMDFQDPLDVIHTKAEGTVEYTALLYIPSHAPSDFYARKMKAGLKLYSKNVFIMEDCQDILPDYLAFVKGLVDSPDFSLNISRELLQHNSQLKRIGKNVEKTILKTLENMLNKDREKYQKFFKEFGEAIKVGIYSDFNSRDKLKKLLLFTSSKSGDTLITLDEYISRMKEGQKVIYYATGKDKAAVEKLPQLEILKDKDLEVLYLFDRVDEFAIDSLREYEGKNFQSASRGDLKLDDIPSTEEKKDTNEVAKENESLLKAIKDNLKEKVADVKISSRLKNSAVCLVTDDNGISLSMEQILSEMGNNPMFKANRILEINPDHQVFKALKDIFDENQNSDTFNDYCELLYAQALLIEGILPDDAAGFANKVAQLMAKK